MIYTLYWIERINKTFKKILRVRGALAGLVLFMVSPRKWAATTTRLLLLFTSNNTFGGISFEVWWNGGWPKWKHTSKRKNYKITRKCQKKLYLCTNNFYTLFGTVSMWKMIFGIVLYNHWFLPYADFVINQALTAMVNAWFLGYADTISCVHYLLPSDSGAI